MKRRPSTSCSNQCPYYCEGLRLGSNVHDCEETVPEDGSVRLKEDIIFILFVETASKSGYSTVFCEIYRGSLREQDSVQHDVSQRSVAQKSSPFR